MMPFDCVPDEEEVLRTVCYGWTPERVNLDGLLARVSQQVVMDRLRLGTVFREELTTAAPDAETDQEVMRDLALMRDAVGSVMITLGCKRCEGRGCSACDGRGHFVFQLELVSDRYIDDVQLLARYLLMAVMRQDTVEEPVGGGSALPHDLPTSLRDLSHQRLLLQQHLNELRALEKEHEELATLRRARERAEAGQREARTTVGRNGEEKRGESEEAEGNLHEDGEEGEKEQEYEYDWGGDEQEGERDDEGERGGVDDYCDQKPGEGEGDENGWNQGTDEEMAKFEDMDSYGESADLEEARMKSPRDDTDDSFSSDGDDDDDDFDDYTADFDYFGSPPSITLKLLSLSGFASDHQSRAKTALLAPQLLREVRKVTCLNCERDPEWVYQLLFDLSPQLEELQLKTPGRSHLEAVERMPRLVRLEVDYFMQCTKRGDYRQPNMSLEEYKFRKPPSLHRGLRFIKVGFMPKRTTFALLRAHRDTLEEMWIGVGTWPPEPPGIYGLSQGAGKVDNSSRTVDDVWPVTCRDIPSRLMRRGASWPNLKRIVLNRWLYIHDKFTCFDQITAIREVLPHVDVKCFVCYNLKTFVF